MCTWDRLPGFSPRYWNLKRAAGYYNWMRRRRLAYRRDVLDRIVADMSAQQPDHVVVTGDLANIGLPQEHINALAWLKTLGPPERVTVIPGNHDIYARIGRDPGTRRWAPYMASNAQGADFVRHRAEFPFVRVLGQVALVGVNSAVPTPPLMAWGRIGRDQLAALAETLASSWCVPVCSASCSFTTHRCLVRLRVHAACWTQPHWKPSCPRHGAELVVHGHNHINMLAWGTGPSGQFPIVGAPSASLGAKAPARAAGPLQPVSDRTRRTQYRGDRPRVGRARRAGGRTGAARAGAKRPGIRRESFARHPCAGRSRHETDAGVGLTCSPCRA